MQETEQTGSYYEMGQQYGQLLKQVDPIAEEIAGDTRLSTTDARHVRLEYADRLRSDVATLAC